MIKEGRAIIEDVVGEEKAFYNPLGAFSRSVGVIAVAAECRAKGRMLNVADVFSATGMRGIRYVLESGGVDSLCLNDASPSAIKVSRHNVELNNIQDRSILSQMESNYFLAFKASRGERFDFVDVDPFGTPAPFIDNAVSATRRGGILAITATDLAPLCGLHRRAAVRKYGSISVRSEFCHEVASRILAYSIVLACGRKELTPQLLLTMFSQHYVRIYARIHKGKSGFPYGEIGMIYTCYKGHFTTSSKLWSTDLTHLCPICGSKIQVAGPLWIGPLHSPSFIERMQNSLGILEGGRDFKRLATFLDTFREEVKFPPYFFDVSRSADRLNISMPKIADIICTLKSRGYGAARTHFSPTGLKTDASHQAFLEAVEEASRRKPRQTA